MSEINVVTLNTSSYNNIKSANFRYEMFVENLLLDAMLSEDHQQMAFDSEKVEQAMKFCFPERYKKKLGTLKSQYKKYGLKGEDNAKVE